MTSDTLLTGAWFIVTFGIVVSGYNLRSGKDPRTLEGFLFRVFMWPLMLALALLIGCFFAVLIFSKIMFTAVNDLFGIDSRR